MMVTHAFIFTALLRWSGMKEFDSVNLLIDGVQMSICYGLCFKVF
jgi:hypothetical protein